MEPEIIGVRSGGSLLTGVLSAAAGSEEENIPVLVGELSLPKDIYAEEYRGNYEVVPSGLFQLLPTSDKRLDDDILVHPIP